MRRSLSAVVVGAVAALVCAVPQSATAFAAPATGSVSGSPATADCVNLAAGARVGRHGGDHADLSARQVASAERQLHHRLARLGTRVQSQRLGMTFHVPVHVHVIADRAHRGPTRSQVRGQIRVLNAAYAGRQSRNSAAASFRFTLDSFERVHNQGWRASSLHEPAQNAMRRALHTGGRGDLNLYFSHPYSAGGSGSLLGFSSFPWQYHGKKKALDGVTILDTTLPGGRMRRFNQGDTVVHEVGHWLGLLHTFQGGCSRSNDEVDDTAPEAYPSSSCDETKDTCTADGLDPVRNFMDYAIDSCMNMFTPGQVVRMTDEWLAFRVP